MPITKFEMISSQNREKQITFETKNTVYQDAVLEAVKKGEIVFDGDFTNIKVWCENLLPDYGPYYYMIIRDGSNLIVNNSDVDLFNTGDKFLKEGTFLGFYPSEDNFANTPFYGFKNEQWIRFFQGANRFELLFRQYSREEIVNILKAGGSITVNIKRTFKYPSQYAFQVVPN